VIRWDAVLHNSNSVGRAFSFSSDTSRSACYPCCASERRPCNTVQLLRAILDRRRGQWRLRAVNGRYRTGLRLDDEVSNGPGARQLFDFDIRLGWFVVISESARWLSAATKTPEIRDMMNNHDG
jgi:hypothetical protein